MPSQIELQLLTAASTNNLEEVQRVLEMAAGDINVTLNVNIVDPVHGMTPLHWSCRRNKDIEMSRLLLEHGANIHAKSHMDGTTPLFWALSRGNLNLVKLLVDEYGANLEMDKNDFGILPLHNAAVHGYLDLMKWMIEEKKLDINAVCDDDHDHDEQGGGNTALHVACSFHHGHFMQWQTLVTSLVKDPNHIPSYKNHIKIQAVQFLLDHGAHLHVQNAAGETPLQTALNTIPPHNHPAAFIRRSLVELLETTQLSRLYTWYRYIVVGIHCNGRPTSFSFWKKDWYDDKKKKQPKEEPCRRLSSRNHPGRDSSNCCNRRHAAAPKQPCCPRTFNSNSNPSSQRTTWSYRQQNKTAVTHCRPKKQRQPSVGLKGRIS